MGNEGKAMDAALDTIIQRDQKIADLEALIAIMEANK